ncbi:MAG: site-2 protease family protein, partial [Candidatus Hydrothermarchaeales archaeon]
TGLLLASLLFVVAPLSFQETGMKIFNVTANSPAARAGVEANLTLLAIDNVEIENLGDFRSAVSTLEPGVPVVLRTDRGDFEVTPKKREDFDRGVIGIAVLPTYKAKPYVAALIGEKLAFTIYGILLEALYWIATLNLAVGLTNLLPIFPLDGGRMFAVFAERIFPRTAAGITTFIYLVILVLVFINMGPLFGLF